MDRLPPDSTRHELAGLADVLEPETRVRDACPAPVDAPLSDRSWPCPLEDGVETPRTTRGLEPDSDRADQAPTKVYAPVADFAFADTVFIRGRAAATEEPPPPSGPVIVSDESGKKESILTPLAFPLPPAAAETGISTKVRMMFGRFPRSDAGFNAHAHANGEPASPLAFLAVWSRWDWQRTDVLRATIIGMSVFMIATFGAAIVTSRRHAESATATAGATATANDDDADAVRAPRTLDQHTGRAPSFRVKAASH